MLSRRGANSAVTASGWPTHGTRRRGWPACRELMTKALIFDRIRGLEEEMSGNVFIFECPKCRRMTCVEPGKPCQNRLSNGHICDQPLPITYLDGTRYFRD